MVFAYMVAAWGGALLTVSALWSYGAVIAIAAAPFGGSTLAAFVAVLLYILRSPRSPTPERVSAGSRQGWSHAHR
ncbi:hypothetical protein AEGHOMDF_1019 [Methylobacterium soli]|nr:hypothetical protein AEGHOMDF_1019 [Methylobacterium soli]